MGVDPSPADAVPGTPPAGPPKPNILRKLHSRMRGRYFAAILMGLAVAAPALITGYKSSAPTYRSTGVLRITPLTLKILYAQNDVAPSLFDGFVDVQTSIMKSRIVVEAVLRCPEWEEVAGDKPTTPEAFMANLDITHPARSELVTIAYTDVNPKRALTGVQLLIREYLNLYGERSGNQRITATQKRAEDLRDTLTKLQADLAAIGRKYGTDDLRNLHQSKMQELGRLETMVKDTEINLILSEAALGSASEFESMPAAEIAASDELLRRLIEEKTKYEAEQRVLEVRLGRRHPEMVNLASRLEELDKKIDERVKAFRKFRRSSFVNNVGVLEGVPTPAAVDALRTRVTKLRELHTSSLEKTMELGRESLRASYLIEEIRATKERLAENQGRLEALRVDSSVVGQINLISEPEIPRGPFKDKRKMMAGGGAAGGFLFGAGLVLAASLANRQARRPDDLACLGVDVPVLAAVPALGPDNRGGVLAAYGIHRTISAWQADPAMSAARVLAVTSPSAGDGKTEIATSLGVAASSVGLRVLLIDFDPVGRRLEDWAGSLLMPVAAGAGARPGLSEVLTRRRPLDECVIPTVIPGLSVIPSGGLRPGQRGGLTAAAIEAVFRAAAARFDLVLADTGTARETLEAPLVCRGAESTILVVTRNTSAPVVNETIAALRAVGASVGGIVFNRARLDNLAAEEVAERAVAAPDPATLAAIPPGWGPVVWAVAAASSPTGELSPAPAPGDA